MKREETPPSLPQKNSTTHIIWLHALVIVLVWLSPFLLSWPLIILGIVLYYLQLLWLGDCILTRRQFQTKKRSMTFYSFVLIKLGFRPNLFGIRFLGDYTLPWIILGFSLWWQLYLHHQPIII